MCGKVRSRQFNCSKGIWSIVKRAQWYWLWVAVLVVVVMVVVVVVVSSSRW